MVFCSNYYLSFIEICKINSNVIIGFQCHLKPALERQSFLCAVTSKYLRLFAVKMITLKEAIQSIYPFIHHIAYIAHKQTTRIHFSFCRGSQKFLSKFDAAQKQNKIDIKRKSWKMEREEIREKEEPSRF